LPERSAPKRAARRRAKRAGAVALPERSAPKRAARRRANRPRADTEAFGCWIAGGRRVALLERIVATKTGEAGSSEPARARRFFWGHDNHIPCGRMCPAGRKWLEPDRTKRKRKGLRNEMRFNPRTTWVALTLSALLALPALAGAQERDEKVSLKQINKKARTVIMQLARGGKILEIEAEREGPKLVYEVVIAKEGSVVEFVVTPEGKVIEFEVQKPRPKVIKKKIKLEHVKPPARDAMKRLARGGKIVEIEAVKMGDRFVYEIELRVHGHEVDFVLAPDGHVLAFEIEGKGKASRNDDEDDDDDGGGKNDDDKGHKKVGKKHDAKGTCGSKCACGEKHDTKGKCDCGGKCRGKCSCGKKHDGKCKGTCNKKCDQKRPL
jgi:uncharacterized membrane protein YkoI